MSYRWRMATLERSVNRDLILNITTALSWDNAVQVGTAGSFAGGELS